MQASDFKEAACCPFAVVQGAARRKSGSAQGNWDPREGQQPFRLNPNGVGDRNTTFRRLLIGADKFCWLYVPPKFRTLLFRKIRVNTCPGNGQKVHIDDYS